MSAQENTFRKQASAVAVSGEHVGKKHM